MHPEEEASLKPSAKAKEELIIPEELKKYAEAFLNNLIATEEAEYRNDLVPFTQHAKQLRLQGEESIKELYQELVLAQNMLKERFCEEERTSSATIDPDAYYAKWEEGFKQFLENLKVNEFDPERPLQEQCGLTWPFMDRAYAIAKGYLDAGGYEEGHLLFQFLHTLNGTVFEYWFGDALCQQEIGKIEEAMASYVQSLYLQPRNPYVFMQLANCKYKLGEIQDSISALEICLECAQEDQGYEDIMKQAQEAKKALEVQTTI